ncbi:MAG: hypothetical protein KGY75_07520 [Candidatus Cloacimonetes bacterium]|nr:hypothetical protein [Candidatus Cloacimonadota bacterium]MBS3767953.1 hypothetical protein [Candidatus Cloacimonadota bacterium]
MNYFSYLCFFWALVGLISRFLIVRYSKKWNKWELNKAYTKKKPRWLYFLGFFGIMLVVFSWYKVFTTKVKYSWIIALLISFTLIKVFNLLFNYNKFRQFVVETLNNRKRWLLINIAIIVFSIILLLMGIFLY